MRTTRVAKLAFFTVLLRAVALALPAQTLPSPADVSSLRGPKHIFIFLADGTGMTHLEISRMYNRQIHNRGLKITDRIFREGSLGLMTTHSADSLISDSAAAATALADGCKAKNGVVGICAEGRVPRSVLEVAKDRGMGIGLVTNSMVYDASPAAFAVHVRDRSLGDRIVEDYLKLKPDVLMGGGRDRFLPGSHPGGLRKDQKDMISAFKAAGYRYVSEKGELGKVGSKRLLGLFALRR